jgi:hypothetical protein
VVGVPRRARQRQGLLGAARIEIGDHHPAALGEKPQRHRPSDAVAAAGDHRHLAVDPSRHRASSKPSSFHALLDERKVRCL